MKEKVIEDISSQPVTCGFVQVGQTEKTSAIVLLSSVVRADRMLSANK